MEHMTDRTYDLVIYGATGFVGKQAVAYLVKHNDAAGLRFAIGGRNQTKLDAVRTGIGGAGLPVDIIVADSRDQASVDAVAACTRVLLNTAGPFSIYGDSVVDACVRFGTHYVDITGETAWVRGLIDRYHAQCVAQGTRIIPFCGFDSVPPDLAVWLAIRHAREAFASPCGSIKAYFQAYGGFNGGTIATFIHIQEGNQADLMRDPFLLKHREHSVDEVEQNRDITQVSFDAEVGTWVGPFPMSPINTRVVRRSADLSESYGEPYGRSFQYQEYLKYDGPLAYAKAIATTAALNGASAVMKRSVSRRLLRPFLPAPGQGPSERTMTKGWMRCEVIGRTDDGKRFSVLIQDDGDPGNRITTKCVCEAALSLLRAEDQLPGGSARGGVLTPAMGLGNVLVERLRRAGMRIEVR
jgi:short subunit dehydrogenase-like uncharacterized protein